MTESRITGVLLVSIVNVNKRATPANDIHIDGGREAETPGSGLTDGPTFVIDVAPLMAPL